MMKKFKQLSKEYVLPPEKKTKILTRMFRPLVEYWNGLTFFGATVWLAIFVMLILLTMAYFWSPEITASTDAMRIIEEWNGQVTSQNFYAIMMGFILFLDITWLTLREQIPQGRWFRARRRKW